MGDEMNRPDLINYQNIEAENMKLAEFYELIAVHFFGVERGRGNRT
jgi:hypothetical protein